MPQHLNNDLYQFPSERKKGLIGTIIIHAVLFAILIVFGFSAPVIESEEGILVNFGFDETGMGAIEPSIAAAAPEAYTPPPASPDDITPSDDEPILTQDFEEAPEVKQVDPDAERKQKEAEEAEKIRQAELEAERIRKAAEEAERQRVLEEQRRTAEINNRTRNAFAARNTGTSSTSEGIAGGEGNQGSPDGSVESTNRGEGNGLGNSGVSYDLAGRGVQSLPLPKYDYQGEGRVVVEVRVDRNGKVTQATPGKQGTTTYDEYLHNAAKEAALKTVFDVNPNATNVQVGTITYNFKLN